MSYKPQTTTYSFADTILILSHPNVGQFTFQGKGLGGVTVSRSTDTTQHDVAADGSVMVSKIKADNGTMALNIQQTSEGHKWLSKWYSYLKVAATSEWARTTAILRNTSTGENITMDGISPQKRADVAYQQTGQQVAWNLMAASISG